MIFQKVTKIHCFLWGNIHLHTITSYSICHQMSVILLLMPYIWHVDENTHFMDGSACKVCTDLVINVNKKELISLSLTWWISISTRVPFCIRLIVIRGYPWVSAKDCITNVIVRFDPKIFPSSFIVFSNDWYKISGSTTPPK